MKGEDKNVSFPEDPPEDSNAHRVRSLRELINLATQGVDLEYKPEEAGDSIEELPFPFFAMVNQAEMKTALLLALINPLIGGVLLMGPRGTGKTSAVRGLAKLLPQIPRSLCHYGCMPEDVESGGIEAICPDCVQKYAAGEPLSGMGEMRLHELPLDVCLDDVIGGVDERSLVHGRMRIRKGILAQADQNILFLDEVNLLSDEIVNAVSNASSGSYLVRRGSLAARYHSRFIMIGAMDAEGGTLNPQLMDQVGLRIFVRGLENPEDRLEVYRRVHDFLKEPRKVIERYRQETEQAKLEIQNARQLLMKVHLPNEVARIGLRLIDQIKIDSLRADITLFEAARAYTAFDNRDIVTIQDIRSVALMALRMRRSFLNEKYSSEQANEQENEIVMIIDNIFNNAPKIGENSHEHF